MTRRVPRRRDGADRPLAAVFRRNATAFHDGAELVLTRFPEISRYHVAIAIELALEAHLLHRGITDDWNRVYIRHDLTKALTSARRAGFVGAPAALPELAALLSPYYKVHGISNMPSEAIASVCWRQACRTVGDLIAAVTEAAIEEGAA